MSFGSSLVLQLVGIIRTHSEQSSACSYPSSMETLRGHAPKHPILGLFLAEHLFLALQAQL